MIRPVLRDDAFLADVRETPAASGSLHLWWTGQSGFLVKAASGVLLLDPYLSDSLTRKYASTDKPHVRMTERVVAPERLGFVDVVTSSHNHTDHLDAETIGPILAANPDATVIVPAANRAFAADRLGVPPERLLGVTAGAAVSAAGFRITGVPAAHEALETDDEGRHRYLGYVVEVEGWTIYHSGDTLWYEGMVDVLRGWPRIDVALLPINGRAPERRVAGNLDGPEAARLAHAVGAGVVIPCHYEMFAFNTASPDDFVREAERIGQPYRVLRAGERWSGAEGAAGA